MDVANNAAVYRQLINSVGQAVIATDLDGRIVFWNRAAERLYGWKEEEVLGEPVLEITPSDMSIADAEEVMNRLRLGETYEGEFQLRRRDGSTFTGLVTDTPIVDYEGSLVGIVGVSTDITQQKVAEQALHDLEKRSSTLSARLTQIFELAPTFICTALGPDHVIDLANESYYRLIGNRDIVHKRVIDSMPEVVSQGLVEILDTVYESGETFIANEMPVELARSSGGGLERRYVSFIYGARRDGDGMIEGIYAHGVDVTEHVVARERLLEVSRSNQLLLDRSADLICSIDAGGRFIHVSKAARLLLGYQPDYMIGRHYEDFVLEEDRQKTSEIVATLAADAAPLFIENRWHTQKGDTVEMSWTGQWSEDDAAMFCVGRDVTNINRAQREKTAAEEALKQSEHKFRSMIQNSSEVIALIDTSGEILYQSPSVERLLGYQAHELENRSMYEIIDPNDCERVRLALESLVANGGHSIERYRLLTKDGDLRWFESHASNLLDDDAVGAIVVSSRDITEVRTRERELLEKQDELERSERRLRTLAETTTQIIWSADEGGSLSVWSDAWSMFTGKEDGSGQAWLDVIHPADVERVRESWTEHLATKTPYEIDYRIRRHDGKYHCFEEHCVPVFSDDGEFVEWIGTCTDVEAKRSAEAQIRSSEERLRLALEASGVGAWEYRIGAENVSLSPEALKLLGLPLDRPSPAPDELSALIHPEIRNRVTSRFQTAIDSGIPLDEEFLITTASGVERWVHVEARRSVAEETQEVRIVGTIDDITERKLHEQGLVRAKEAAQEMARLKDTFLANMSHEIRTPLTSIIGFSSLLAEDPPEDVREMAHLIFGAGKRLMATLDSVLTLAQLESGSLPARSAPIDIVEVIRDQVALFRHDASAKGLRLEFETTESSLFLPVDEGAISRISANLLSNAIKFTTVGSISVCLNRVDDGIEIQFSDTGIGISREFLPHMYSEFRQESEGLCRGYEGVGLGLPLVKKLVKYLNGSIQVSTAKNAGTTFSILLPAPTSKPVQQPHRLNGPGATARL
jgi:PAS domain S-box-containing protein